MEKSNRDIFGGASGGFAFGRRFPIPKPGRAVVRAVFIHITIAASAQQSSRWPLAAGLGLGLACLPPIRCYGKLFFFLLAFGILTFLSFAR